MSAMHPAKRLALMAGVGERLALLIEEPCREPVGRGIKCDDDEHSPCLPCRARALLAAVESDNLAKAVPR